MNPANSTIVLFIATTLLSLIFVYQFLKPSKLIFILLLFWLAIQAYLSLNGFYLINNTMPPRFILLVLPPLLFIIILFNYSKGKLFLDQLNLKQLTLIHIVRIPVEIVLLGLYTRQLVPQIMTFEGTNFDILSGISAPFIYYFVLNKVNYNKKLLLVWNIICLALLLNIVGTAILSAPSPFQKLAFNQPNVGVLLFPFNWLPSFIVPLVLFCHLAAIRKLLSKNEIKIK
jgi:hypothetical protein